MVRTFLKSAKRAKTVVALLYYDRIIRLIHPECWIGKDDLITASFPKSGCTWVRFFIANYIDHYYNLGVGVTWDNFVPLTPGPLCKRDTGIFDFPPGVPRVIFSHNSYLARHFKNRKVIYITRKFFDILVSTYFFRKHRNFQEYNGIDVNDFVRSEFALQEAVDKLNLFSLKLKEANEYLLLPFEKLKSDPEYSFTKLIEFSNYPYNQASFDFALEQSSFQNMRRLEEEQRDFDSEEGYHTRKGKTGGYKKHLHTETINYVTDYLETYLKGILKPYYL